MRRIVPPVLVGWALGLMGVLALLASVADLEGSRPGVGAELPRASVETSDVPPTRRVIAA